MAFAMGLDRPVPELVLGGLSGLLPGLLILSCAQLAVGTNKTSDAAQTSARRWENFTHISINRNCQNG